MLTPAADQARNHGNRAIVGAWKKQVEQDALGTIKCSPLWGERERENLGTTGVFGSGPRRTP